MQGNNERRPSNARFYQKQVNGHCPENYASIQPSKPTNKPQQQPLWTDARPSHISVPGKARKSEVHEQKAPQLAILQFERDGDSQDGVNFRYGNSGQTTDFVLRNNSKFGSIGGKTSPLTYLVNPPKNCKLSEKEYANNAAPTKKNIHRSRVVLEKSQPKDENPLVQTEKHPRGNSTMHALLQSSKRRSGANGQIIRTEVRSEQGNGRNSQCNSQSQNYLQVQDNYTQNRSPQPTLFKPVPQHLKHVKRSSYLITRNVPESQQRHSMVQLDMDAGTRTLPHAKSVFAAFDTSSHSSHSVTDTCSDQQTFSQAVAEQNLKAKVAPHSAWLPQTQMMWTPEYSQRNLDNFSAAGEEKTHSQVFEVARNSIQGNAGMSHRQSVKVGQSGKPPITPSSAFRMSDTNKFSQKTNSSKDLKVPRSSIVGEENIQLMSGPKKQPVEMTQPMPSNSRNINSVAQMNSSQQEGQIPLKTKFAYQSANKTAQQSSDMKSGMQQYEGMPTYQDETNVRPGDGTFEEHGIKEFYSLSSAEQQSRKRDYGLAQRLSSEVEFTEKSMAQISQLTKYEMLQRARAEEEKTKKDLEYDQKRSEMRRLQAPEIWGGGPKQKIESTMQPPRSKVVYINAADINRKTRTSASEASFIAKGPSLRQPANSMSPINTQKKAKPQSPEPTTIAFTPKMGIDELQITKTKSLVQIPPLEKEKEKEKEIVPEPPRISLTGFLSSFANIFNRKASPEQQPEEKKPILKQQVQQLYGPGKYNSFAPAAINDEILLKKTSPKVGGRIITFEHNNKDTDPDCNEEDALTPTRQQVMMSPNMSTQKSKASHRRKSLLRSPMQSKDGFSDQAQTVVSQINRSEMNRTRDNINQMMAGQTQFSRFIDQDSNDQLKIHKQDSVVSQRDKKRKTVDSAQLLTYKNLLFNQENKRASPANMTSPRTGIVTPCSPKTGSLSTSVNILKDHSPPMSPSKLQGLLHLRPKCHLRGQSDRGESTNSQGSIPGSSLQFGQQVNADSHSNEPIDMDKMAEQKRPARSTYVKREHLQQLMAEQQKSNASPQLKYSVTVKHAQIDLHDSKKTMLQKAVTVEEKKSESLPLGSEILKIPGEKGRVGSGASTNYSNNATNGKNSAQSPDGQNRNRRLQGHTTAEALDLFEDDLTPFEKQEMQGYKFIYTVGSTRIKSQGSVQGRDGFYNVQAGEQIAFRYQVECTLGRGAFGQVVKCIDYREGGRAVALKISKCSKTDVQNTFYEAKWLKIIQLKDPSRRHSIVELIDDFKFRQHYVLVFELLGANLYDHIKSPTFKGMPKEQLRSVAKELLVALQKLKAVGIIHCDLKPENIMFTNSACTKVKIIDFGSSCDEYSSGYAYVQSRFYRSPEVLIGVPYDAAIDMWSFGCILAELCTTRPLFPAHDELELLERMRFTIGMPPPHMMRSCAKRRMFLDKDGKLNRSPKTNLQPGLPDHSYPIRQQVYTVDDDDFIDFLEKCLTMDPQKRLTPEQGLKHKWITRNKMQTLFKEMDNTSSVQKAVLGEVFDVLSYKTHNKQNRNSLKLFRSDYDGKN